MDNEEGQIVTILLLVGFIIGVVVILGLWFSGILGCPGAYGIQT